MSEHPPYVGVTLASIDEAIHRWFDRTVDAHVSDPRGQRKKVVVSMAAGERWVTAREKRGMRDKNGVLILPLISIRRSAIEPDQSASALGTETGNIQISKKISPKSSQHMNLNAARAPGKGYATKPTIYEVTTIPFPDRSVVTYEVQVQSQYIVQMNSILEKIFHQLDVGKSFVAPLQNDGRQPPSGTELEERKPLSGEYVVGFFESTVSDGGNFEEFTDQERIVRFTTQIRVPTVLRLDPEGTKPVIQTQLTSFVMNFGEENVRFFDDEDDADDVFR